MTGFDQPIDNRLGGDSSWIPSSTCILDMVKNKYTISILARTFGLSRSTLLYYDRIGLLSPTGRSGSGYRLYSEKERHRLERICNFRQTGLTLDEIQSILRAGGKPTAKVLEHRLNEISGQISHLKAQQRLLSGLLSKMASSDHTTPINKDLWVDMLRAAGMDEGAMARWHAEFERRAPEAHHEFLLSLDIPQADVIKIRQWAGLKMPLDDSQA